MDSFKMYARKLNGAIYVSLSGGLDISRAVEVLSFLNLYARGKQPIVMDTGHLSPACRRGMEVLDTGLRRLSDLGHPVRQMSQQPGSGPEKGP